MDIGVAHQVSNEEVQWHEPALLRVRLALDTDNFCSLACNVSDHILVDAPCHEQDKLGIMKREWNEGGRMAAVCGCHEEF